MIPVAVNKDLDVAATWRNRDVVKKKNRPPQMHAGFFNLQLCLVLFHCLLIILKRYLKFSGREFQLA